MPPRSASPARSPAKRTFLPVANKSDAKTFLIGTVAVGSFLFVASCASAMFLPWGFGANTAMGASWGSRVWFWVFAVSRACARLTSSFPSNAVFSGTSSPPEHFEGTTVAANAYTTAGDDDDGARARTHTRLRGKTRFLAVFFFAPRVVTVCVCVFVSVVRRHSV